MAAETPANRSDERAEQPGGSGGAEPPASFDDWLDGRLKSLYQTVLNEPLPSDIMNLLGGQKKPDGTK